MLINIWKNIALSADWYGGGGGVVLTVTDYIFFWQKLPFLKFFEVYVLPCLGAIADWSSCWLCVSYSTIFLAQSSQRNASIQSLLLAGNFFVRPITAECWRGRGGKLSKKITNEHPVFVERVKLTYRKPTRPEVSVEYSAINLKTLR